jgi:hypothetical protein
MINAKMRQYNYSTFGDDNGYGSPTLSDVKGSIKMAITVTSQTVQDNIKYKGATYLGLTHAEVDDTFVISYGNEKLKVLYVNPEGRYNQVFMSEML